MNFLTPYSNLDTALCRWRIAYLFSKISLGDARDITRVIEDMPPIRLIPSSAHDPTIVS
jgi:hypothetical protein